MPDIETSFDVSSGIKRCSTNTISTGSPNEFLPSIHNRKESVSFNSDDKFLIEVTASISNAKGSPDTGLTDIRQSSIRIEPILSANTTLSGEQ